MSRSLVVSNSYNLFFTCWLRECGLLGDRCDLLLIGALPGQVGRLEETRYFDRVLDMRDQNAAGTTLIERYRAMQDIVQGSGRPYRNKARYLELTAPSAFYPDWPEDWDVFYNNLTFFIDSRERTPVLYHIMSRPDGKVGYAEQHGIIFVKATRTFSASHYDDLHSLWLGLRGIGHPSDRLEEFCTVRPEFMAAGWKKKVRTVTVPTIARSDKQEFIHAMNRLFDFQPDNVGFDRKRVIFFPHGYPSSPEAAQEYLDGCNAIAEIVGRENFALKLHPSRKLISTTDYGDLSILPHAHIPWEVFLANYGNWNDTLLISPFTTNSVLLPKVYFDDEPYVMHLYKLFPLPTKTFMDDYEELFQDMIRSYRDPSRFFIPETWEEAEAFLRRFAKNAITGGDDAMA